MSREEKEIHLTKTCRTLSGSFELALSTEQILKLQGLGQKRYLRRGEQLLSEGSIVNRVYILNTGAAEILAVGSNEGKIRTVRPGEILGLTETLAGTASDFEISSASESVFTEIPREELIAFLRKDPETCFNLVSMMATAFVQCCMSYPDDPRL